MALLKTYSAANKIILNGKTRRITCGSPSDPVLSASNASDGSISVSSDVWYEMICHSTASFAYVGMDLSAAKACRDAMIRKFTRGKKIWEYKTTYDPETKVIKIGWVQSATGAIVQEAEVDLTPMGGHMYQVTVQVDCEDTVMTTSPSSTSFSWPDCMNDVD